jgi:hypothetical protein
MIQISINPLAGVQQASIIRHVIPSFHPSTVIAPVLARASGN